MFELVGGVVALLGTIASIAWYFIKKSGTRKTPEEDYEEREKEFNEAMANGDANSLTGIWEQLSQQIKKGRDRSGGPGDRSSS